MGFDFNPRTSAQTYQIQKQIGAQGGGAGSVLNAISGQIGEGGIGGYVIKRNRNLQSINIETADPQILEAAGAVVEDSLLLAQDATSRALQGAENYANNLTAYAALASHEQQVAVGKALDITSSTDNTTRWLIVCGAIVALYLIGKKL